MADPNGPYTGTVGQPVQFDGSESFDPDGSIVSYDWDFGDGTTGSGETPTHTYASAGDYNVTLTVTDNDGATDSDGTTAHITPAVNEPPVADANGPYSGAPGEPIEFDGSGSFDIDGTIVDYAWDFGDGNTGSGETPTHTYDLAGDYDVTLTVTDNDGATHSDTTTAEISEGPCPSSLLLEGTLPGIMDLLDLYRFRDEVMAKSALGSEYIDLYYEHGREAVRIMIRNPKLARQSKAVLSGAMPKIRAALEGRRAKLSRGDIAAADKLLGRFAAHASPELKAAIGVVRSDLKAGRLSSLFTR